MNNPLKRALIEFICTILICASIIIISILFKSPLQDFVPLMNQVFEWIVENYLLVIIGVSTTIILVLLKNLLLRC